MAIRNSKCPNFAQCKNYKESDAKLCGACYKEYRRAQAVPAAAVEPPDDEKILGYVKRFSTKGGVRPEDIETDLKMEAGTALAALQRLASEGRTIYQFGERWSFENAPNIGGIFDRPLVSDKNGWHMFGAIGDTHMCSKQERLEELHDIYRIFEANGVKTVIHTGNYIDGEARFNKFELNVHGMDAQLRYMADNYPKVKGIETLMISGDDHEGWYAQREGVDIGNYMQMTMERHGRGDIKNLGYMECFLPLQHRESGAQSMLHAMHPGGGSAYATSYTVQKIVEGYEGGEKPAILLAGHYHKAEHLEVRNVHCFQTGCFQDQTVFARKKKLTFTIGGWLILARQNPETGAIEEVVSYFKKYYNKGYYVNQRWSLSGPVAMVPRLKV